MSGQRIRRPPNYYGDFAPAAAAGAGGAPAPAAAGRAAASAAGRSGPKVSGKKGPALSKTVTGLGKIVEYTKKKRLTRDDFESVSDVHKQCKAVIGDPDGDTLCWLCGFKTNSVLARTPPEWKPIIITPMLDNYTCEHVLPIKLAFPLLGLYSPRALIKPPHLYAELLHTEYEYAHNLCNFFKNDKYFVTQPNPDNLCSIQINEAKIDEFLDKLPTHRMHGQRESYITFNFPAGIWPSAPYAFSHTINNLVEANLIIDAHHKDKNWFNISDRAEVINDWKSEMKSLITAKMQSLVDIIKEANNCGGKQQGRHQEHVNAARNGFKAITTSELSPPPSAAPGFFQGVASATRTLVNLRKTSQGAGALEQLGHRAHAQYETERAVRDAIAAHDRARSLAAAGAGGGAGGGHVEAALAELASLETALAEAIYDYNLAVENGYPREVISALNDKQILAARALSEMDEYIKSLGGGGAAPAAPTYYGSGAAAPAAPTYYGSGAAAPAAAYGGVAAAGAGGGFDPALLGGTAWGGRGGKRKKHTRRRKAHKRKHRRSTRK
jgi:hypothetical protein